MWPLPCEWPPPRYSLSEPACETNSMYLAQGGVLAAWKDAAKMEPLLEPGYLDGQYVVARAVARQLHLADFALT